MQSIQLADRLKKLGREQHRDELVASVNDFITDLYSYKLISPDGTHIDSSGHEIAKLCKEICEQMFSKTNSLADRELSNFLADKQKEFVRLVLERARRLLNTIETIGANQASNEKIDSLLNKMETANLDWLIETYSVHLDVTAGKARLPELDNRTQKEIANAVLVRMNTTIEDFNKAAADGAPKNRQQKPFKELYAKWILGDKKAIDLSQTNLLETEQFVVELRLQVSYRQQITILSSILDKVNEFSSMLSAFEATLSSTDRSAIASAGQAEIDSRNTKNSDLKNSKDPMDQALADVRLASQRPLLSEIDLQKQVAENDAELARSIKELREFFTKRNVAANQVLAKLIDMANKIRVMAPMVIQEAQQNDAQFTTKLLEIIASGAKSIQQIEGALPATALPAPGRQ